MCLAIPAQITKIDGYMAVCATEGVESEIGLHLVKDVKQGDWVLVHAGYAIQIIDEQAAAETMDLIRQLVDGEPDGVQI